MRLGKKEYQHDERTVRLARDAGLSVKTKPVYDFDKRRKAFPGGMWGNDVWGDCMEVAKYNSLVRVERIETRRTLRVTENDVVMQYRAETGAVSPGGPGDDGLYMLQSIGQWRNEGLLVGATFKRYRIAAYGEINVQDREEILAAIQGLTGVLIGIALPLTARDQIHARQSWDVIGPESYSPRAAPGSWGGHAVYCKRHDTSGFFVKTWGEEQYMTNAFLTTYVDEMWAVVDDLETRSKYLDVAALTKYLHDIGATNVG